MGFTHIDSSGKVKMVDITEKDVSYRYAVAEGIIELQKETLKAISENKVAKGNVLATAIVSAMMAVKKTSELIPMCHPIPVTHVEVDFELLDFGVKAICSVKTTSRTGVEMEALVGVSHALLTIWDMVKSLEKDETGNYPHTRIKEIKVVKKKKTEINE
jgi:cyclic pyranopterin phosphate synthase